MTTYYNLEDKRLIVDSAAYTLGERVLQGNFQKLVEHVAARTIILGQSGDLMALTEGIDPRFIAYMQSVTGQRPEMALAPSLHTGYHSLNNLKPLEGDPRIRDRAMTGYNQHEQLARWGDEHEVPMAETPSRLLLGEDPLMERVGSKAYFRRVMEETGTMLPQRYSNIETEEGKEDATRTVKEQLDETGGAFVQLSRAGGGLGNLDITRNPDGTYYSGVLGELKDADELYEAVAEWIGYGQHMTGSTELITTPLIEGDAFKESPTITAYIPPKDEGEPVIYGRYGQILHPVTRAYEGFLYPDRGELGEEFGEELDQRSMHWFRHLQEQGYVGNADLDWLIGEYEGEIIAIPSESNVRMNAYRFMMQIAAIERGWNLRDLRDIQPDQAPHIVANDHVHTEINDFQQVIQALRAADIPLFGMNGARQGLVVTIPPLEGQCGIGVMMNDPHEAWVLYEDAKKVLANVA